MKIWGEDGDAAYYNHAILITGLTGIATMFPSLYFYQKDRRARMIVGLIKPGVTRHLKIGECLRILLMGAGFAQFANMLVNILGSFLNADAYQESMSQMTDGKSLLFLIVCMGIIAPLAEEMIFRWLIYLRLRDYMRAVPAMVISGVFFGIYHGNLVQGVYASILGILFAYFMELTGSLWASVLLHVGANIWSLILPELAGGILKKYPMGIMLLLLILMAGMYTGTVYFQRQSETKNGRNI